MSLMDPNVSRLITFLKERPRATKQNNRPYIDTGNNRELICLPRHAVIFGRRGSGKTMLLGELTRHGKSHKRGLIWIDVDDYKTLAFPDILIQILRSLFVGLRRDVCHRNPWYLPHRRIAKRALLGALSNEEEYLFKLLQRFEESELRVDEQHGQKVLDHRESAIKAERGVIGADFGNSLSREHSSSRTQSATGRDRKIDHISRHLHDAKELLRNALSGAFGSYYLVLDDFYHLTVEDQAQVLDYLQSLTKNIDVFIKFGTIAHRSSLYRRDGALIHGMQKEHDVLPIDLDRTFQNFSEVEQFISQLWSQIIQQAAKGTKKDELFAGDSWQQLMLASGGVPRDFMNILTRALEIGRSRRKDKLDVFLINEAANLYLRETKHEDLTLERAEATGELEEMLLDIRDFCVSDRKRNLFLVDKDVLEQKQHQLELLRQLVDYRFIHLVHSNTSSAGNEGRYAAFMLDVGLYGHPQRRGSNRVRQVDFLARDERHRADTIRTQPIYQVKEAYAVSGRNPFEAPPEPPEPIGDEDVHPAADVVSENGVQRLLGF